MHHLSPMPECPSAPAPPADALRGRRRRGEAGSAFAVALLVLLVLSIAGLALTLMTQTEVRIGSNERTTNRSFYAADSGIEVATALNNVYGLGSTSTVFKVNTTNQDTGLTPATTFSDQVTVTPLITLYSAPCPYCQVNQNNTNYYFVTYVVNSTAARTGVNSGTTQTFSQRLVSSMMVEGPTKGDSYGNAPVSSALADQIPVQW